jgi:hypothetical protein
MAFDSPRLKKVQGSRFKVRLIKKYIRGVSCKSVFLPRFHQSNPGNLVAQAFQPVLLKD